MKTVDVPERRRMRGKCRIIETLGNPETLLNPFMMLVDLFCFESELI
jgi:hypothetical protein